MRHLLSGLSCSRAAAAEEAAVCVVDHGVIDDRSARRRQPDSDQTCHRGRHGLKSESVLHRPFQQLDLMAVDEDTFLRAKHRTFIGLTEGSSTLLASSSRLNFSRRNSQAKPGFTAFRDDFRQRLKQHRRPIVQRC